MHRIIIVALACTAFGCSQQEPNSEKIEEVPVEGKISEIIRTPVEADGTVDTFNVAKIEFEEEIYDFGEVNEGDVVTHVFRFRNTGRQPLIISDARSTCGCTVPEWPKEPIPPGGEGEIVVRFNTAGKKNHQSKPVTITANTFPSTTRIYLRGFVHSDGDASNDGHGH
ncbi:MAG: DUF1573 domain-containing protein [Bacteroidetes bacterium]|nr:MAG: DUF1573 domain-containing protein [Bacteroidota bacterium]